MSVQLVNATGNQPVQGGDKFRITWGWVLSWMLPGNFLDVRGLDQGVRNALPLMSHGFVPVSAPQAVPGDTVVVYDVRLSQAWSGGGNTVADVVAALDLLPAQQNVALNVTRVERLASSGVSSGALAQGQSGAVQQGNASNQPIVTGSGLARAFKFSAVTVAVVAAIALGLYAWRKGGK